MLASTRNIKFIKYSTWGITAVCGMVWWGEVGWGLVWCGVW